MTENKTTELYTEFLPVDRADMAARGWDRLDFVVVGGDAYVDHPSFCTAIITTVAASTAIGKASFRRIGSFTLFDVRRDRFRHLQHEYSKYGRQ